MWIFLSRLKQGGALVGATPEQAFYVRTSAALESASDWRGAIALRVGFAPRAANEFVTYEFRYHASTLTTEVRAVRDVERHLGELAPVPAAARCLDDEPVACRELDDRRRRQVLAAAVGAQHVVAAALTRPAAGEARRRHTPPVRENRRLHRLEELDFADDAVAAAPPPGPARAAADREFGDAHGIALLEHLGIGEARVRHVCMHGARARETGPGAGSAA